MISLQPLSESNDHRRKLITLIRDNIKEVNFVSVNKGAILGQHYHPKTKEYFFIVKGACLVTSGDKREPKMRGDLFVIHPGTRHEIECLSKVEYFNFLDKEFASDGSDICK